MIYIKHIKSEAVKYIHRKGLKLSDKMNKKDIQDFQNFLITTTKIDRKRTKQKEIDDSKKIGNIIKKIMPDVSKFESPIEEFLHNGLKNNGLEQYFTPQYKIGKYRVDFACEEKMLVVECDGKEYHFTEKSQIERDQKRDKYLARKGWRVLHIEGLAIRRNIDLCISKVKKALGISKTAEEWK